MADALQTKDLSVTLGDRTVLRALSFDARFGELLAVVGPNGAGKSTLLRALCGLLPSRGEITLEGKPLAALSASERARRVSFVPQQSKLTAALRVHEVVRLGRFSHRASHAPTRSDDERALERAIADTDLESLRERVFSDLSAGEQKRVLLARALCTEARVLLLDEPTAALDIEHALQLFVLLRRFSAEGRAIVVVLHQLEHALSFSDRALLLLEGQRLALGPTRDVLTPELVLALHRVQLVPGGAPDFRLPERR